MHMKAVYANAAVGLGVPRKTLGRGESVTGLDPVHEAPLVLRFMPKQVHIWDQTDGKIRDLVCLDSPHLHLHMGQPSSNMQQSTHRTNEIHGIQRFDD